MRTATFTALTIFLASATIASAVPVSPDLKHAPPGVYQLDPRHTQIVFSIAHFGITNFYGRFDRAAGSLNFDSVNPEKSSVSISIDTTSLDTQNDALTRELQGAEIFDAAHSPAATFNSTSVTRTGPNSGKIAGNLTIKGITKPVVLDVTYNGSTLSPMSARTTLIGFHGETTIKRSDYNMTGVMWSSMVGDNVNLIIEAPFALKR